MTFREFLRLPVVRALAALIGIVALGAVFNADGAFFKFGLHRDMLRELSVYGILACGMTLVVVSGGIDLSVGSVLGLTSVLFAMFTIQMGWPALAAAAACVVAGWLCGTASGVLVARFRVQPFIATLGMMVFARGLAKFVSGGQKVSTAVQKPDGSYAYVDIPPVFDFLNSKVLGGNVAVVTLIFFACLVVTWIVLSRLRWGRYVYALGGNEEAARLSGVPVGAAKLLAYGLCGLFSGIAGICQAAQESNRVTPRPAGCTSSRPSPLWSSGGRASTVAAAGSG